MNHTDSGWTKALLIALGVFAFYVFFSSQTTLWDRDEPRYARATVEMIESGDFIVPTFNGKLRLYKPPLIYWAMVPFIALFGQNAAAARMASVLAMTITVLQVFYIAKTLIDKRAAWWAMAVTATSGILVFIATSAITDSVLVMFMTLSVTVFVHYYRHGPRWYHPLLYGLSLGAAQLTKGPVGLIPVITVLCCILAFRSKLTRPKNHTLHLLLGVVIGIGLFVLWGIPANNATDGEFFRFGIGRHVVYRIKTPMESHGGNFFAYLPFYIPVIFGGLMPWCLLLPGALASVLSKRAGGRELKVVFYAWFLPIFIIMSLIMTKMAHYILFAVPVFSLAVGAAVSAAKDDRINDFDRKWFRHGAWISLLILLPVILGMLIGCWFIPIPGLNAVCIVTGSAVLFFTVRAFVHLYKKRVYEAGRAVLICALAFTVGVFGLIMPVVDKIKLTPQIARVIRENTPHDLPVGAYIYREPSLAFYMDRTFKELSGDKRAVIEWKTDHPESVLIIPKDIYEEYNREPPFINGEILGKASGLNISDGTEIILLAVLLKAAE